jgi:hypothetical protein
MTKELTCRSLIILTLVRFSLDSETSSNKCSRRDLKSPLGAFNQTSKSHNRSWNAVIFGMAEDSWPLFTVPTKLKVKCRIWEFSKFLFFLKNMARVW